MINYEIKSQLAKLLATEDLIVENRNVSTASFDVERRVLTLPMWQKASNNVYDMLVGHEVGHALFTPNDWTYEDRVPREYVNVTEDARIEKLMKRKYAGLSKSFYRGYEDLSEQDFFELKDQDLTKMSLADRVNLHFKVGNFVTIPFSEEERQFVEMTGSAETFADAVLAAEAIYGYSKSKQTDKTEQPNEELKSGSSDGETQETETQVESFSKGDSGDQREEEEKDSESEPENSGDESPSMEVTTDQTFSDGMQDLNNPTERQIRYYQIPDIDLNKVINSNFDVHSLIESHFKYSSSEGSFHRPDEEYFKFKKTAQREVNYLVKEFECKKSADAYARATTSRTGVLDCTKLHTYKYNEDLFKKVSIVPDGKNHGLIFILDWSGSMADVMEDTIKQLYNLVWFCSKVNIPFEVYAFTNSYIRRGHEGPIRHNDIDNALEGDFVIDSDFSLMNILTSKVNKKTLEKQMLNLYRTVYSFRHYVSYDPPAQVSLSGTPLNESLVVLQKILPKFKKENNLQKVQTVILTDGEAHQLHAYRYYDDFFNGETKLSPSQFSGGYLRNRKTGYTYQFDYEYWKFTEVLLKNLKQMNPDTNFIGIRLVPSREFNYIVRRYNGYTSDDELKKARKDKSFTIKDSGYDTLFTMIQSSLSENSEFKVEEDASKAKIKSAFTKSLKAKTLNKKVLSQFMDLVC